MNIFGSNKVITKHINEIDLSVYFIDSDLNNEGNMQYRIGEFINVLQNVIPEFAFGFHKNENVEMKEIIPLLIEASKSIYSIKEFQEIKKIYVDKDSFLDDDIKDKYLKRGEFGELILHLILRDYHHTIPLISKIYFKDSYGHAVHGFDAVHIDPINKTLWLGESKLYSNAKHGINMLIEDLKEHFNVDYLRGEFSLISKKLKILDNLEEKDYWIDLMHENTRLIDIFNSVNIPLICTYTSEIFNKYEDFSLDEFINELELEIKNLKEHFDNKNSHPLTPHLNIQLILFPVKCKKDLVKRLHKKLFLMQELGNIYD